MITDEMVEVARAAYHDARSSGIPRQAPESLMRAALTAVLPMIRSEVLEEAAVAMDDWPCRAEAIRAMKGGDDAS
jgi:hypothetical protein